MPPPTRPRPDGDVRPGLGAGRAPRRARLNADDTGWLWFERPPDGREDEVYGRSALQQLRILVRGGGGARPNATRKRGGAIGRRAPRGPPAAADPARGALCGIRRDARCRTPRGRAAGGSHLHPLPTRPSTPLPVPPPQRELRATEAALQARARGTPPGDCPLTSDSSEEEDELLALARTPPPPDARAFRRPPPCSFLVPGMVRP